MKMKIKFRGVCKEFRISAAKIQKNNKKFYLALNIVVCQLFRIFAPANCILIK
jgi:hypothetical protein